jgi:hypothetical protein
MPWHVPSLKWAARRRLLEFAGYRIRLFTTGYNPAAWVFSAMLLGFLGPPEFRSRNSSAKKRSTTESKPVVFRPLIHDHENHKIR